MNVSFTKKTGTIYLWAGWSGDFQNASEVVRDALRLHEFYRHCIIQDLKTEIEKGWSDKISSRSVRDIIKSRKESK